MNPALGKPAIPALCLLVGLIWSLPVYAQTSATDTAVPHYTGSPISEGSRHDGGLRPVVGVNLYQVARGVGAATPGSPSFGDGVKSDIRHHPMIAYWNDRYWVQYLPEAQAVLATSADGVDWRHATSFGDLGTIQGKDVGTHTRAAFYVDQPTGKLLVNTFYGTATSVNNAQGGFVRAVREVTGVDAQGKPTLGPAYGLLYNKGFEGIAELQPFTQSGDAGFVAAANRMLDDRLYSQQFYEEHRDQARRPVDDSGSFADYHFVLNQGATGTGPATDLKALSYWTLPDGRIAGVWKGPVVGVTENGTDGWVESNIQTSGLVHDQRSRNADGELEFTQLGWHGTSKVWGQRLPDGRYALVGNFQSTRPDGRRTPLVVSTSQDGINFDGDVLVIAGDLPMSRYPDVWPVDHKDMGLQYVRGITPGNGDPADGAMWVTFSSNKEDIWLARVPHTIRGSVQGPVHDDFEGMTPGGIVADWNVRSGQWTPVRVINDEGNHVLRLADRDPYDHAKAVRVFEASSRVKLDMRVRAGQNDHGTLHIEVNDAAGKRPVRLALLSDGTLRAADGPPADAFTFAAADLSSYHNQDHQPDAFAIEDDGRTLALTGNAWKKKAFDYTITRNTVLAFDFMSTREGEVHGICFDTDNATPPVGGFKLLGTESTSLDTLYNDYVVGSGWRSYRIDVGNFFTGQVSQMVFINDHDHDNGTPKGDSRFRDVMVFEDDGSTMTVLRQYAADQWLNITLELDAATGLYEVMVNGELLGEGLAFAEAVESVERIEFRTGAYMMTDMGRRPVGEMLDFAATHWLTTTLPGADTPVDEAVFDLDQFAAVPEPGSAAAALIPGGLAVFHRPSRTMGDTDHHTE